MLMRARCGALARISLDRRLCVLAGTESQRSAISSGRLRSSDVSFSAAEQRERHPPGTDSRIGRAGGRTSTWRAALCWAGSAVVGGKERLLDTSGTRGSRAARDRAPTMSNPVRPCCASGGDPPADPPPSLGPPPQQLLDPSSAAAGPSRPRMQRASSTASHALCDLNHFACLHQESDRCRRWLSPRWTASSAFRSSWRSFRCLWRSCRSSDARGRTPLPGPR